MSVFGKDDELEVLSNYFVVVILDIDWIKKIQAKPGFVANRLRQRVKQEVKNFLGIDVTVGSVGEKCDEVVKESKKDYIITESQLKVLVEVNNPRSCCMS